MSRAEHERRYKREHGECEHCGEPIVAMPGGLWEHLFEPGLRWDHFPEPAISVFDDQGFPLPREKPAPPPEPRTPRYRQVQLEPHTPQHAGRPYDVVTPDRKFL